MSEVLCDMCATNFRISSDGTTCLSSTGGRYYGTNQFWPHSVLLKLTPQVGLYFSINVRAADLDLACSLSNQQLEGYFPVCKYPQVSKWHSDSTEIYQL